MIKSNIEEVIQLKIETPINEIDSQENELNAMLSETTNEVETQQISSIEEKPNQFIKTENNDNSNLDKERQSGSTSLIAIGIALILILIILLGFILMSY